MLHPSTELKFISPEIGFGVVATKFIPKGTITWVLDKLDQVFSPEQIKKLGDPYYDLLEKYSYRNSHGHSILCWDLARFINHSSNSNCMTTAYEFEIAVRDIHPGEELTDDYGYLNLTEPFHAFPAPGEKRHTIYPDDLLTYYSQWDEILLDSFPQIGVVDQPLYPFITSDIAQTISNILLAKQPMDSILNCYCPHTPGKINGELARINQRSPRVRYPY